MKKITMTLAALAALSLLAACQKELITEKTQDVQFMISVDRDDFGPATKAVKTGWANGDKVYVFFDRQTNEAACDAADDMMTMTYNDGSWSYDAPAALTARLLASGTLDAIYCTETPTINYGYLVTFQGSNTGACGFFSAAQVAYTYSDSKVKASISLSVPTDYLQAQVRISGLTGSGWYINCSNFISYRSFKANGYSWVGDGSSSWGGNCYLGADYQTYVNLRGYLLGATTNYAITLSNGTNSYTKTFSSKALSSCSAVTFAGPDNLDSPGNGWTKQ